MVGSRATPTCEPGQVRKEAAVSGPVGSHGVAVMSHRPGIEFEAELVSRTAPLTGIVEAMLAAGDMRWLRDATRGGLASVLNELAEASNVSMTAVEADIPVLPPVRAVCEMLGLDPLYVPNEGVCVARGSAPPGRSSCWPATSSPASADPSLRPCTVLSWVPPAASPGAGGAGGGMLPSRTSGVSQLALPLACRCPEE